MTGASLAAFLEGFPTVDEVLARDDLVKEYEMKNRQLVAFLAGEGILAGIIARLVDGGNRKVQRIACAILASKINRGLLMALGGDLELLESLVNGINRPDCDAMTIGMVCSILEQLVEIVADECFAMFSRSRVIYRTLISRVETVSVFSFLSDLIVRQVDAIPVVWMIFKMLVGKREMNPPEGCDCECVNDVWECPDSARPRMLEIVTLFVGVFMTQRDFMAVVSEHLPYLMEFAKDDEERKRVFMLGTLVPDNRGLCRCAVSVIESFQVPDCVIVAALEYVLKMSRINDVLDMEQIVRLTYRLLTQRACNFLYNAALKVLEPHAKDVIEDERIKAILTSTAPKTVEEGGFRMALRYFAGDDEWKDMDSKGFSEKLKTYKVEAKPPEASKSFDILPSHPPRFDSAWMLEETD